MGRLKQLLPLGNSPVLRHTVDALKSAGIQDVVVVCGKDPAPFWDALAGSGVRLVANDLPDSQMADSVRIGIQSLEPGEYSAVLVCLADHPLVLPETYRTLLHLHERSRDRIVIPQFRGRRGHPSLFPAGIIEEIFFQASLRDIVHAYADQVVPVEVPDEGVVLDMDTEADYQKVQELHRTRRSGSQGAGNV